MTSTITQCVDQISSALRTLSELFADPSALAFDDVRRDMERLEEQCKKKATIDAAFAFIAERDEAGRVVGANYPSAYLQQRLDLSKGEAYNRLERGRLLFAPPPEPPLDDDSAPDAPAPDNLFDDPPEDGQRKQQDDARRNSARVSAPASTPRRWRRRCSAARRTCACSCARRSTRRNNPNAGYENRGLSLGQRNPDGTVRVIIDAPAGDAALFKAHADKGLAPNSNLAAGDQGDVDKRTPRQRRYDQFKAIFQQYEERCQKANGGAASVVVAVTLDDLADGDASMLYGTNTGIEVDCFDLVRLGMEGTTDFVLQVDGVTSVPLWMGRTSRLASVEQRIAMFAVQGVCSWLGCTAPMTECEAHHILAWIRGGSTDIENLTGLCREHHRCNNVRRDGSFNKGYMDFDPQTSRSGYRKRPSDPLKFNESVPARHSAVSRVFAAKGRCECARSTHPDPAFYPPGYSPPQDQWPPPPRQA